MALHGMLSALRELILDSEDLPPDEVSRRSLYSQRFRELSDDELADLARIPTDKLYRYTSSIFAGEREILNRIMAYTFACCAQGWAAAYGKKFQGWDFVRVMHRTHPWVGNETVGLIDAFVAYASELTPIHNLYPEFQGMLALERAIFHIRRAKSEPIGATILRGEALSTLSVEELLACSWIRPAYLVSLPVAYDLVAARREFIVSKELPKTCRKHSATLLGARTEAGMPRWVEAGAVTRETIMATPADSPRAVADLAQAILADIEERDRITASNASQRTEAELFCLFFDQFQVLCEAGIIFPRP